MRLGDIERMCARWLPERLFNVVDVLGRSTIGVWNRVADHLYYPSRALVYAVSGNVAAYRKVRSVWRVRGHSMVGRPGLLATYDAARGVVHRGVQGNLVECGVARGGCAGLMWLAAGHDSYERDLWLFDTFEGLPTPGLRDAPDVCWSASGDRRQSCLHEGYCYGSYEEVEAFLCGLLQLPPPRIQMVKGLFADTLPAHRQTVGHIAMLRIDADWYESVLCCLANLWQNVVVGGVVFIDDYDLVGCREAVDAFFHGQGTTPDWLHDGRGGAWFVRQ